MKSSKRKLRKLTKKILASLDDPAPMSYNKGPLISTKKALTKKRKRRKCHVYPRIVKPTMKWKDIIEEALEPSEEYEPWNAHNDCMKDWGFIKSERGEREKKRKIRKERRRKKDG